MKILLVNKFLYPKGGSETYVINLGRILREFGHSVQFFGLKNDKNVVGNDIEEYVSDLDFNNGIRRYLFPFRIIYSIEAGRKIKKVLYNFEPDVIHLNNIQFHLTPSIILEIEKYRKKRNRNIKIIYTAHDYQLVCPSHGLFDTNLNPCEKCLNGCYINCFKSKCLKNSRMKSLIAMIDAYIWKLSKVYKYVDTIICPSNFLKSKLDTQEIFRGKTVALHNFAQEQEIPLIEKENYILQFGHLSKDKGTETLLEVAKKMPDVKFVFAGYGESVESIKRVGNASYVGFKNGDELKELIRKAMLTVCSSEMYENCPYSVMESQLNLTPVIGSEIGGIPELIINGKTGILFEAGNATDLENKITYLVKNPHILKEYTENCKNIKFETPDSYYAKLLGIYEGKNEDL